MLLRGWCSRSMKNTLSVLCPKFSHTCKMQSLPWQRVKGWRPGQRRVHFVDRMALFCPKISCFLQRFECKLVYGQLVDNELHKSGQHKRMPKRSVRRLSGLDTLELMDESSQAEDLAELHWLDDLLMISVCLFLPYGFSSLFFLSHKVVR